MSWNVGWLGLAPKKWNKKAHEIFWGRPEENFQEDLLSHAQKPIQRGLERAVNKPGGSGAFGEGPRLEAFARVSSVPEVAFDHFSENKILKRSFQGPYGPFSQFEK